MLQISEAANLAIHALALLDSWAGPPLATAHALAQRMGVSETHLGKVLQRLARLGYLNSTRGARGGFRLARSLEGTTVLEVVEALDGPLPTPACLLGRSLCPPGACRLRPAHEELRATLRRHLGALSIHDLAAGAAPAAPLHPGERSAGQAPAGREEPA